MPNTLQSVKETMGDRLVIASASSSPPKVDKKGLKIKKKTTAGFIAAVVSF